MTSSCDNYGYFTHSILFTGTGGEVIANALVCSFALLNKEQRSREHPKRQSQQKCVLYCFPNEEMAHQTASKSCSCDHMCMYVCMTVCVLLIAIYAHI